MFVNTMDKFGDEATMDMIIDRTITEYCDDSAKKIGKYAFYGCTALTEVNVPNVKEIEANAFYGCTALTELTSEQFPIVEKIHNAAFDGCTGVTIIDLPGLTGLNCGITQSSALVYVNCPNADVVNNSASVSFGSCHNLETVLVPKLRYFSEYGGYTFQNCAKLQNTDFSSLVRVGMYMFNGCKALSALDFPKVTSIQGQKCFASCTSLITLILRAETVCTLANVDDFESTPIADGTGYVYVPSALVDSYKAATNWSTYADQIRAIEDYPDICGG